VVVRAAQPEVAFSDLCQFTKKQMAACEAADTHLYTLYGGSRGPGKSYWLRWYLIRRLLQWAGTGHRGVRVGLFCEDYPSLTDRQISKMAEFPPWLGRLRSTRTDGLGFYLHECYGGGGILLRNLDDPTKYQSVEFAGLAIDELTKDPESVFDILRGSLRWPGVTDPFFAAATNPNGRYFKWVRRYWIERDLPENLAGCEDDFVYVAALPADNPYLDAGYWAMLNTLPKALRQAWVDGDWYVGVDGLVYATFGSGNVTTIDYDPERPFELGVDDGYVDPRAVVFIQKQGAHVVVFDEIYESYKLEEETVRGVLAKCYNYSPWAAIDPRARTRGKKDPFPDDVDKNTDLARWLRERSVRLPEMAAVAHEAAALRKRFRQADIPARNWMARKAGGGGSTRAAAIRETRALILDGQRRRTLLVHRRCKNLLDELQTGYKNRETRDGFVDEPADGNDHAAQAVENWVWLRGRAGA